MRYVRLWCRLALMTFQVQSSHLLSSTGYLFGKLFRLAFFLIFLTAIFRHTKSLAGYSLHEVVLFFLTFNLIDMLAQLIFRGVYSVRALIREGDFDYFLIQPVPILFRVLFNNVDFLDVVTLMPIFGMLGWVLAHWPTPITAGAIGLYTVLLMNGLFIAFAIHLVVASVAVWTQELENTIWVYRDLMTLGRFPADIYKGMMQNVLKFIIPIAVMITFPVKGLIGVLETGWIVYAFLISFVFMALSHQFWLWALSRYTSASS